MTQILSAQKHCIVSDHKINLTSDFTQQHLSVDQNARNSEAQKLILLDGEPHLYKITHWLNQLFKS